MSLTFKAGFDPLATFARTKAVELPEPEWLVGINTDLIEYIDQLQAKAIALRSRCGELERELSNSRINHVDANERNMRANDRAAALPAERNTEALTSPELPEEPTRKIEHAHNCHAISHNLASDCDCIAPRLMLSEWQEYADTLATFARSTKAELEAARRDYIELILAVAKKWPNETRHQTALRYIIERENRQSQTGEAAITGSAHE